MTKVYTVGFSGTRNGLSAAAYSTLCWFLDAIKTPADFRHGDCIGADSTAHYCAQRRGFRILIHPPEDTKLRAYCKDAFSVLPAKPYLERNREIAVMSDRLFAAVPGAEEEHPHSGTWATVRYAKKAELPVTLIFPDGSYEDMFPWE